MNKIQVAVLSVFSKDKSLSSGDIFVLLAEKNISQVTIKRHLTELTKSGFLQRKGKGRSIEYALSIKGTLLKPFDVQKYNSLELDKRNSSAAFNFELFKNISFPLFTEEELSILDAKTKFYRNNFRGLSDVLFKKEVERFTIELAWKSSKIEGNTYTLLDTERLIREGIKSEKNSEAETIMILNHKHALEYIFSDKNIWNEISVLKIESLHGIITQNLNISRNIRNRGVGITGTPYKPLENKYQIREALDLLVLCVNKRVNVYEKALLTILGLSYVQAFEDGNKRTARLAGNAVLLAHHFAPISYRSVDEVAFREACLVFYEQNSIEPFKKIFIEQYIFAAVNYNIGKA